MLVQTDSGYPSSTNSSPGSSAGYGDLRQLWSSPLHGPQQPWSTVVDDPPINSSARRSLFYQEFHANKEDTPVCVSSPIRSAPPKPFISDDGFVDVVPYPQKPMRNVFIEPGSGMRDVPHWLKGLRLHKYTTLFQQMDYDQMIALNDQQLETQGVTKGARRKILASISKLVERVELLKQLEKDVSESGGIRTSLCELRSMIQTPIRPFPLQGRPEPDQKRIDGIDLPAELISDDNLPAHFIRVLGKVHCAMLETPDCQLDEDAYSTLLHILDRCINHDAFTLAQKRRVLGWKQAVKKVCNPNSLNRRGSYERNAFDRRINGTKAWQQPGSPDHRSRGAKWVMGEAPVTPVRQNSAPNAFFPDQINNNFQAQMNCMNPNQMQLMLMIMAQMQQQHNSAKTFGQSAAAFNPMLPNQQPTRQHNRQWSTGEQTLPTAMHQPLQDLAAALNNKPNYGFSTNAGCQCKANSTPNMPPKSAAPPMPQAYSTVDRGNNNPGWTPAVANLHRSSNSIWSNAQGNTTESTGMPTAPSTPRSTSSSGVSSGGHWETSQSPLGMMTYNFGSSLLDASPQDRSWGNLCRSMAEVRLEHSSEAQRVSGGI